MDFFVPYYYLSPLYILRWDREVELSMDNYLVELAKSHGATHKASLGVYQFYTHELEEYVNAIRSQLRDNCSSWMYSLTEIEEESDPIKKAAMNGYNQAIADCMCEIAIFGDNTI